MSPVAAVSSIGPEKQKLASCSKVIRKPQSDQPTGPGNRSHHAPA